MFRNISHRVTNRSDDLIKKNSSQERLNDIVSNFLKKEIGINPRDVSFSASIENGNLYINTRQKTLANEIVFRARALYSTLKQNRIVCNNLVIR